MQLEPRQLQFFELHFCEQIQLRARGPCLRCRILPAFARVRLRLHGQVNQRQQAPGQHAGRHHPLNSTNKAIGPYLYNALGLRRLKL